MTIGSINTLPVRTFNAPAAPAQPPADEKPAPREPGLIRRGVEGVAGLVGGSLGAVYHMPIGTLKGVSEGLTDYKNEKGMGWYNVMTLGQGIAIGAAVGALYAGPLGAAIGAGAGLLVSGIGRFAAGRAGADEKWVDAVEKAVDKAVEDNKDGTKVKLMVQNATEGAIIGTGVGFKEGWNLGREAGKGAVGGFLDVGEGIAEGLKEVIFGS